MPGDKTQAEAVGSLLDDAEDYRGGGADDAAPTSYGSRGREYEDGVIGIGVGDELEGRAFDDGAFNKAFAGGSRRRPNPRARAARQRAMRGGATATEARAMHGDTGRGQPLVLDGADLPNPERVRKLAEIADAEARLAAFTAATEPAPSPPPPEPPAPSPKPAPSTVGSAGDKVEDLAALEAELGLGSPKVGHAPISRERAPPETMGAVAIEPRQPTPEEVGAAIEAARESGEIPSRTELEAMLEHEGEQMTETSEAYMPPAKSVNHMTPMCVKRINDLVWPEGVDLDPFASRSEFATIEATVQYFGPDDEDEPLDGLVEDWDLFASEEPTRAFVNSPYGRFQAKACAAIVAEVSSADVRVLALLKSCTDTAWFHEHVAATATAVCFVRGRLRYIDGDTGKTGPAPFPSILILWDDDRFGAFKKACEVYVDKDRKHPLGRVVDLRIGRDKEIQQTDSVPS